MKVQRRWPIYQHRKSWNNEKLPLLVGSRWHKKSHITARINAASTFVPIENDLLMPPAKK